MGRYGSAAKSWASDGRAHLSGVRWSPCLDVQGPSLAVKKATNTTLGMLVCLISVSSQMLLSVLADSEDYCRPESFCDSACPVKTACQLLSDCSFGVHCSELLHAFHCMAVMSVNASDVHVDLI